MQAMCLAEARGDVQVVGHVAFVSIFLLLILNIPGLDDSDAARSRGNASGGGRSSAQRLTDSTSTPTDAIKAETGRATHRSPSPVSDAGAMFSLKLPATNRPAAGFARSTERPSPLVRYRPTHGLSMSAARALSAHRHQSRARGQCASLWLGSLITICADVCM